MPIAGDVAPRRTPASASACATTSEVTDQISCGIVLHPSRAREVLGELAVAAAPDLRLLVQDEDGRAGGALVDRDDRPHCLTQVK